MAWGSAKCLPPQPQSSSARVGSHSHSKYDGSGTMGIVEETEAKLAALRLRLPELEGKANKK